MAPQRPAGAPPSKVPPPSKPRAALGAVVAAALLAVRAAAAMTVPQHCAFAPTQGQPAFPFTIQDAQKLTGPRVRKGTVNSWAKYLRPRMTETCGAVDLEAERLPWRRWISTLPMWEGIFGEGVVAIELRRLRYYDHNTKKWRTDIIVTRADGASVRLHPHAYGKGVIPIGDNIEGRVGEDDLAIERAASAASTGAPRRAACLGAATSDDAASAAAGHKTSVSQARPDAAASDDAVRSAATAQRASEAAACDMTVPQH